MSKRSNASAATTAVGLAATAKNLVNVASRFIGNYGRDRIVSEGKRGLSVSVPNDAIPMTLQMKGTQRTRRRVGRGRRRKKKGVRSGNIGGETRVKAPFAVSSVVSGCGLVWGKPRKLEDMPYDGAVRLSGVDLSDYIVYQKSAASSAPFSNDGGGSFQAQLYFGLNSLGSRTKTLCSCYEYYVFRNFVVEYVPVVNVNTTAAFAFGIDMDTTRISNITPVTSIQLILERCPSSMGPGWVSQILNTKNPIGTKTYEVYPGASDAFSKTQYAFLGASMVPAVASTAVGFLRVAYTVDLYCPSAVTSSISLLRLSGNSVKVPLSLDTDEKEEKTDVVMVERSGDTPRRSISLPSGKGSKSLNKS